MASLTEIVDLVGQSLARPDLAGADLAAAAHLSRFHFDRVVAAAVGEPPGALRRRLLLERAAVELATSDSLVIDVAGRAGYSSPDAFGRAFKREFGTSPVDYRRSRDHAWWLPSTSGVHFHPPGGLRLPPVTRRTAVNILGAMVDHHIDTTRAVIDRMDRAQDVLDVPITLSIETIDRQPTLRSLADRLVLQLETWVAAIDGRTSVPRGDVDPDSLRSRLDLVAPRFRALVVERVDGGDADETFLDATCDPPRVFTLGGVLAHVLTFAAVRRTFAIGALESAGIADLGSGDPMQAVGGTGEDASRIRRTFES